MLLLEDLKLIACLVILHALLLYLQFLLNFPFSKKILFKEYHLGIRVANSLDPDESGHFIVPDLGPNCLL